jgi:hypothetical protein
MNEEKKVGISLKQTGITLLLEILMTKYFRICNYSFADRFNYCPICGKQLEIFDRHYREDEVITNKEILTEIKEKDRKSILNYYISITLSLEGVAIAYSFYKETQNYAIFFVTFAFIVMIIGWIFNTKKVYYRLEEWRKNRERAKKP